MKTIFLSLVALAISLSASAGTTFCAWDGSATPATLADGKNVTYCYGAAAANRARMRGRELASPEIARDETARVTRYRIRIPFRDLAPLKPVRGTVFGLSFLAFDMDRASGYYFIQSTPGVAEPVDPAQFLKFTFD